MLTQGVHFVKLQDYFPTLCNKIRESISMIRFTNEVGVAPYVFLKVRRVFLEKVFWLSGLFQFSLMFSIIMQIGR